MFVGHSYALFCIFERCLDSNPERAAVASRRATNLATRLSEKVEKKFRSRMKAKIQAKCC